MKCQIHHYWRSILLVILLTTCTTLHARKKHAYSISRYQRRAASLPLDIAQFSQQGRASWYGRRFHGRRTASGERYNMYALSAAHRTLPLFSYVRVTNTANRKSIVVRINDRGPAPRHRVIDLSYAAAKAIGLRRLGTGTVKIQGIADP